MLGPHGRPIECERATTLKDPIEDGVSQILVVQDAAPAGERLVGGEDHRAFLPMAIVHHVEEHVRGISPVGEIADLVANEDRGMDVASKGIGESAAAKRRGEVVDQLRGGHKQRVEAVLDRAVGDRHGEMRFASTWFPAQDQTPAFGDKVRREGRAQERQADGALIHEIEIVDRLQKRKVRAMHHSRDARLLPLRDLFGDEESEDIPIAPLLSLRSLDQLAPGAPSIGQVQALEQRIKLDVGEIDRHRRPPSASKGSAVLARVQTHAT
jgi:hypothetical protein